MLSSAFLNRLDSLRLAMKGRARGGAGGNRRSRQLGSSAEFSDYREYIPGDDIRRLDWNALARFDRLYLKLFMEEQESQVTVLLDGSASMAEKWDLARDAAAAVGYLALTGGDRLRVIFLREGEPLRSPQLSGRGAYPRLQQFLDALEPGGSGDFTRAVRQTEGLPKGLCFLVTDGYTEDGLEEALDFLRYQRQECSLIQVLSPFEMHPELEGAFRLEDCEGAASVDLLADRTALEAYQKTLARFLQQVQENCHRRETSRMLLTGEKPFEESFIPLLSGSGMI